MLAVDLWRGIEWPMDVPEEGVARKGILKPLQCNEKHSEDTKIHSEALAGAEMVRVLVYSRRNRQIFKEYKKAPGST